MRSPWFAKSLAARIEIYTRSILTPELLQLLQLLILLISPDPA
jgi:hypothetical protein